MDQVVSSTPSPSPETPAAAPATEAPSPSSVPGQRPTFEQVFATDATSDTPTESAPPDEATTPPADATAPGAIHPGPKQGPIPFEVHKTALDNARTKATAEAQATFDREYGWAKSIPPQTIQQWSGIASLMASDPPAFLEKYFAEAATHPTFGPQVKSWAAKTLSRRTGTAQDLSPDVVVQDGEGREVARTFSAERVQAIVAHTVQDLLGKEVMPLKQDLEQRKAREQQQVMEARQADAAKRLEASTDAVLADISELLDITDATAPETRDALYGELNALLDADEKLSPHKAAMQLRKTRIVPTLEGKAQQQVLDTLTQKAGAQGMNPTRAGVASTHRPKSFNDPSLKW